MINRRAFVKKTLLGSVALAAAGRPEQDQDEVLPGPQKVPQPNILVFVADDAGMDFGCYGNTSIKTPNIDALAKSGLRFEQAFLTSPQCSPSRTSMLSGQFAHTIGTEDLHTGIHEDTRILPSYLKEAGYYTGYMLKGHLGEYGHRQFDWYDEGTSIYRKNPGLWGRTVRQRLGEFIDQSGEQPFFMWVGFIDPHRGYGDSDIQRVNDPETVQVPAQMVDTAETRRDLADYYDEISRMDRHIGEMIEELETRGLRENTLILFLSDNGMPFPRAKGTVYDAGIQTPLIASWKGHIKEQSVHTNGLFSTIDLAPTLLDVAGTAVPKRMFGESMLPVMKDATLRARDQIFAERNWHNCDEHIRCVRTETHKFILNSYTALPHGSPSDVSTSPAWFDLREGLREGTLTPEQSRLFESPRAAVELYDLTEDAGEFDNVAGTREYHDVSVKLYQVLENWRKETWDHPAWQRRKSDNADRITGARLIKGTPEHYWDYTKPTERHF